MGDYILITGASSGIGRAIAKKLAEEGYSLYLHYHQNKEVIAELIEDLNTFSGEFIPVQADLSAEDGYQILADQILSIDGIIHNCGISHYGLFADIEKETVQQLISIHVTSPMLLTKELLPKMLRKQKGNIIVISSIWGQIGAACEVVYSAAKGAQISFVKALSKELALNGIRVNGVAPGAVETPMLKQFSEDEIYAIMDEIPMGRLAQSNEIAESVSFLLSKKSAYITGQILGVNGGWFV